MLPWIFGTIMVFSGGFFVISMILGEIGNFFDGISDSIDVSLEAIGIDIIPDSIEVGGEGEAFGCLSVNAFLTGFGAAGLVASLNGAGFFGSVIAGFVFGLVTGGIYIAVMSFMLKQQSNTLTNEDDLIGSTGTVTTAIHKNGNGQVRVSRSGASTRLTAKSMSGDKIPRGTIVEIVSAEGGYLIVKPTEN